MRLERLSLRDFRNFESLELSELSHGINVFVGRNAMGKTNLIEAINYLSCGKSFRGTQDSKLIREGQPFAGIFAGYSTGSHRGKIEIGIFGEAQCKTQWASYQENIRIDGCYEFHRICTGGSEDH